MNPPAHLESSRGNQARPSEHADLALAVYFEPNVEGRRVLLLGDAQGVLADRFDRLASQLEIIDPAAREPSRGEVPELPFDDRTFDLVLVCDVAALPEPVEGAVRELRRVLSRDGLLALASPASGRRRRRGPSPRSALEALLAAEFRHVRVLTQAPIAGYALGEAEARAGEEFSVDSSLVGDRAREPERLLGLGSEARLPLEGRLWVEVPVSPAGEESPRANAPLIEELRRAEDEARDALHRESALLRELEGERRARAEAEAQAERAHMYERKLLAAEADYDDAVARVRYFEGAFGEHEAATRHERERREVAERELAALKKELARVHGQYERDEAERADTRAELATATQEIEQLEGRLVAQGKQLRELEQDKRAHEQTARDLLEELRRLERDNTAAVEHDARVSELEAERDRALARAVDAEVARESAQMRADELRAELEASAARRAQEPGDADLVRSLRSELGSVALELTRVQAEAQRARGETRGLALRLAEAEAALAAAPPHGALLEQSSQQAVELRARLTQTEAELHVLREALENRRYPAGSTDGERSQELERQLGRADQRLAELNRELEEADRFAELHAEDAERLTSIEAALQNTRDRVDDLEQDLRATEEELRAARAELHGQTEELTRAQHVLSEAARREAERDDALAALADARAILSQLAGGVGADENDPPSILQAVLAQRDSQREGLIEALREEIARRDARIAQLEGGEQTAENSDY